MTKLSVNRFADNAEVAGIADLNLTGSRETATYIGDVCLGLRSLATKAEMPFLAHLLGMVFLEAQERSNSQSPAKSE